MIVWIRCAPDGPYFPSASPSKFGSRQLLMIWLYSGEDAMTWPEIKAEGWVEKQFRVEEVIAEEEVNQDDA